MQNFQKFYTNPTVAFQKSKWFSDCLMKSNISNQQIHFEKSPCGKCKLP